MIKCTCNICSIWGGCTCGAIEEERRLLKEGKILEDANKNNKPLINCAIETNNEYFYFKFVKIDESIRGKGCLGTFNGYEIKSMYSPDYYFYKTINIFGIIKQYDNEIVECNKEIISALEEAGCKVIIK